jgi:PAS domain S-box-containing protein
MSPSKSKTQEHYQIILDSIADGVFTINTDFFITSFNRAAEKITGITKTEAIGRPCFEVFRSNVCGTNCLLNKTIRTEHPTINTPIYIFRADNKRISISVNTAILKDAKGHIIGGVEIFRDLTAVHKLRNALRKKYNFEDIVSRNAKMLDLFAILPRIAESNSTVLLEGASGTGKELFARAIHNNSPQKEGPFIPVNCGALPDTLFESELFGYRAGAFTDAKRDKPGRFTLAQNGTIFLDEIGDISLSMQTRLLRVLEEKYYEPLGSTEPIQTNARVIAATHRNLKDLVAAGQFREDLFFRINIIKLALLPLSERKEDIPLLADHFIEHFNHLMGKNIIGISQKAMAALMLYDWPGNVREIENAIEHAFVLSEGGLIGLHHLPDHVIPPNSTTIPSQGLSLKEIEKTAIFKALQRNEWKKLVTAQELGIDKGTLRRKIKQFGIQPMID